MDKIPRSKEQDYSEEMAEKRRAFAQGKSGAILEHVGQYSFDPGLLAGNIEHFTGVAQVPIGLAGPLRVNGEFAKGDFYVPLATTEGTLVASYNRGMKLTRAAGGITTTVLEDAMQRAPVFVFENARNSRDFGDWVQSHFDLIRQQAESSTQVGKLLEIEQHALGSLRWLRFHFSTGDAAGQNMVTRASRQACQWILTQKPKGLRHFTLAANFDTDKKHSHINNLRSRGKRVIAEIVLPSQLIKESLGTTAAQMHYQRQLSNAGATLSGSINNGSHSANGITALFIATGQDVANVAESSAGILYGEIRENGDYYISFTIPSLIVASYGGGTHLPTQKECLSLLGCLGKNKVNKLAEIVAATVLCGELSLSAAIIADEWVSSHEQYGRNR